MRNRAGLTPEPVAVVCQCNGWWYVQFTFHAGTPHEYRSTAGGYIDRQSAEDYAAMILRERAP